MGASQTGGALAGTKKTDTRLEPGVEDMKKILMTAAAAVVAIAATSYGASAADKLKVGFIYLGPVGDLGWTYQHEVGRQELVKALGDKIETTYLENVSEGPDAERSIEQLARTGHQLIFTTSFGFMDPTVKVAKKYPKIKFEHATGYKNAPTWRPIPAASTKAATSRARSPPRCRRRACSATSSRSRSRK